MDALGPRALRAYSEDENGLASADELGAPVYAAGRTSDYLIARAATIYGGSQQVQRGIIAKLAFGL